LGDRLEIHPPEFDPQRLALRYGKMSVFCYPSLALEGEGLSVAPLEAMASAAVPVLSRLDCYDDVVTNGANGFRFNHTAAPKAVAHELSEILAKLILDQDLRTRLGRAAQETARRFDYEALGQSVLNRLSAL
jgi:glycosyltransferase involved in cell wall biosynthesis